MAKQESKQQAKPKVQAVGEDGNIFMVVGNASKALKKDGQADAAAAMQAEVQKAGSYDEALQIIMKYVDLT